MRIKMLVTAAGPGGVQQAGQVYDLPRRMAEALIEAGSALETTAKPIKIETAEAPPRAERAVAPSAKGAAK